MFSAVSDLAPVIVSPAAEQEAGEWNGFVHAQPDASFCHLWQWRTLLNDVFGHRSWYLIARSADGEVEGVLPLVQIRGFVGRSLVSVPYLNYGGPLGAPAARLELTRSALSHMGAAGTRRLELRSRGAHESHLSPSRQKVTVVLPLPGTVEELWTRTFRSKLRSQIRRAQKEQMEVRFGPQEEEAFYRVFSRNMRDLGTPVLPRAFFRALLLFFPQEVVFGCVYAEGVAVAAGCGFVWNGEFEITWASALREHNAKAPNMLLYSSFMEEMITRGVASFNFGRCTPGGGTHRFKLQWGGSDEPLHWTGFPGDADGSDEPGSAFQLASRVWQRLPLPVAEAIGPRIAARLPQY